MFLLLYSYYIYSFYSYFNLTQGNTPKQAPFLEHKRYSSNFDTGGTNCHLSSFTMNLTHGLDIGDSNTLKSWVNKEKSTHFLCLTHVRNTGNKI